jgi:hypoxanthine-DNA glycosylase
MEIHSIDPVCAPDARILILGSFPSVASRQAGFYYAHKQNRFFKVLAAVFGEDVPVSVQEKKQFLIRNKIALWDVIKSCDVDKSSDSSIRNVAPNDIAGLVSGTGIKAVYLNGKTALSLYEKYVLPSVALPYFYLPSTSPANAAHSLDRLVGEWAVILNRQSDRGCL